MSKLRVAIVGLGFGMQFIPIYQEFSDTECVAVCRRDVEKLNECGDRFGVSKRYSDYGKMLEDPEIDAVHINSDINSHGWMTIAALKAGKHVASTVGMAMTREECEEIVRLEESSGLVYMMMETAVYTREFLYFKKLYESGKIGRLQFLRGSHIQNMSMPGWPDYWYGMPPMYYPTHAVAPLSEILNSPVKAVRCEGSGRIREEYAKKHGSPFAVESAHLTFADSDVKGEITRSLFDTIRQYRESFDFYGSEMSFEWEQCVEEKPVIFTGLEDAERVQVPDTDVMLPASIARFARKHNTADQTIASFIQGSDHGGSHPHMVHEFVNAVKENRRSWISARVGANWTIAGLFAHESAMRGGERIEMPEFTQFKR